MRNKWRGQDIRARLGDTVIRYDGRPYYCTVDGEQIVLHDLISRQIIHRKTPDDPGLDVSSLDLGYVNLEVPHRAAVYLERLPSRRYRQGVDFNNLRYTPLVNAGRRFGVESSHMWCQGFVDSHMGVFPSFKKSVSLLTDGKAHSVAMSKQVALKREDGSFKVYIQTEEVGWIKAGTSTVIIPKTEISWVSVQTLELVSREWKVQEGIK
jgi:hypothetical protein